MSKLKSFILKYFEISVFGISRLDCNIKSGHEQYMARAIQQQMSLVQSLLDSHAVIMELSLQSCSTVRIPEHRKK